MILWYAISSTVHRTFSMFILYIEHSVKTVHSLHRTFSKNGLRKNEEKKKRIIPFQQISPSFVLCIVCISFYASSVSHLNECVWVSKQKWHSSLIWLKIKSKKEKSIRVFSQNTHYYSSNSFHPSQSILRFCSTSFLSRILLSHELCLQQKKNISKIHTKKQTNFFLKNIK